MAYDFRNCLHDWKREHPRANMPGVGDTAWKQLAIDHCRGQEQEGGYYSERIEPSRSEGYSRADYVQYHELEYYTVPVHDELQQGKQSKLNRVKERYNHG